MNLEEIRVLSEKIKEKKATGAEIAEHAEETLKLVTLVEQHRAVLADWGKSPLLGDFEDLMEKVGIDSYIPSPYDPAGLCNPRRDNPGWRR